MGRHNKNKKKTTTTTGNEGHQQASSSSLTPTTTKKSILMTGSQGNKLSHSTHKVPTYWVHLLLDQHGELFLFQKGKVHWSYQTDTEMYSLFVSEGEHEYADAGDDMLPYSHTSGHTTVICHNGSIEDLQEKLTRTYGEGIQATIKLFELDLDYQTGDKAGAQSTERFSVHINRYDVLCSSSAGPPTLRWHLVFADVVKAVFPNTEFSCEVFYARNLNEFMNICREFDIKELPGGRNIEDLIWREEYRTKMILVDPQAEWNDNTVEGLYEGLKVRVTRIRRTSNIVNIIKKIRYYDDDEYFLHFYGWQIEGDWYYLAFEMCCLTLENFKPAYNYTDMKKTRPVRVDILSDIAKGVYSLQRKGINHGMLRPNNIFIKDDETMAKLGPCSFVFEEEKGGRLNTNMHDLAKILLCCTSAGSYEFSDQEVTEDELALCNLVEARDLIENIISGRIKNLSDFLHHHFFWGTLKRLSFMVDFSEHIYKQEDDALIVKAVVQEFQKNKVYKTRWDNVKGLSKKLLNEMKIFRVKHGLEQYNFFDERSLVRFIRNAFNHHGSFTNEVYEDIGFSKLDMEAHFEKAFPQLLGSLHKAGLSDPSDIPNSETYYVSVEGEDETIGTTDKNTWIIGSQVYHKPEKVPTGLYYWFGEEEIRNPVHLLLDQHGELFLFQKGKVHWCHQTDTEMYSLFVSEGEHEYADAGDDMLPYSHTSGLTMVISHNGSIEDLQEKLARTYGEGVQVTSKLIELDLDYQTGDKVGAQSTERFLVHINRHEVLCSSSAGPPTLRWRLVFADVVKAVFPNTEFSCEVFYARNLNEFMNICREFDIKRLPGGKTIEEINLIRTFRKKMISVDPEAEWRNNTTKGIYEGLLEVTVIRIKKRTNIINIIKKLRDNVNENFLRFYGWEEEGEFYYLAFEKCEHTLTEYVKNNNFTHFSGSTQLRLDILRGIAKGVFSLQSEEIYHVNLTPYNVFINAYATPKLGPCRFVFEDEIEEETDEHKGGSLSKNLHDFAKILLYCTSGGSYVFTDQEVTKDELALCKIVEARDLIDKILSNSITTLFHVLGHPFFWGTLERIGFIGDFSSHMDGVRPREEICVNIAKKIEEKKVFVDRWNDSKYLADNFVQAMDNNRKSLGYPPYIYTDWKSLLKFMKNAFNHYKSIPQNIRDEIGPGKGALETYFRNNFLELLIILFNEGLPYRHTMKNFSVNYLDKTAFRATGNK